MRQEAIELIVALKGHTLPKGAENAYNRFCKAIAEEEKQDVEQSSTESKETFDQPVAWMWRCKPYCDWPNWSVSLKRPADSGRDGHQRTEGYEDIPLYTTPLNPLDSIKSSNTLDAQPQREWVGLTDEDEIDWDGGDLKSLVKAIEAKLRSKNQ